MPGRGPRPMAPPCSRHHVRYCPLLSVTVRYCQLLGRYCPLLSVTFRYCPLLSVTVRYRSLQRYCLSVAARGPVTDQLTDSN